MPGRCAVRGRAESRPPGAASHPGPPPEGLREASHGPLWADFRPTSGLGPGAGLPGRWKRPQGALWGLSGGRSREGLIQCGLGILDG